MKRPRVGLLFFFLFFIFLEVKTMAYIRTRTLSGAPVKWAVDRPIIILYLNPQNNNGLSDQEVITIVREVLAKWEGQTSISFDLRTTRDRPRANRNDIYFSSGGTLSSGVLALSTGQHDVASGNIFEVDIALNDNWFFTADKFSTQNSSLSSGVYLGDVLSHELGHLLGLGHGQVRDSSMIFIASKGQHSPSDDDLLGINDIYQKETQGVIKGKIIGGQTLVPLFGAHIQLISQSKGKVIGAAFSNPEGEFYFRSLELNDQYYLYVSPAERFASLPSYFATAARNFCLSNDYRGGFFSKCGGKNKGFPQGIELTTKGPEVDIGNISISCELDVPREYLSVKDINAINANGFALPMKANDKWGNAFVGFFTEGEVQGRYADVLTIDLTEVKDLSQTYLEIHILSQDFFSYHRNRVLVYRDNTFLGYFPSNNDTISSDQLDADGIPSIDVTVRILLSLDQQENTFEIQVVPIPINADSNYSEFDFFPGLGLFKNDQNFYLGLFSLVKKEGQGYSPFKRRNYWPYEDNSRCPQGPRSFSVPGFVPASEEEIEALSNKSSSKSNDGELFHCAGLMGRQGPGPGSSGDGLGLLGKGESLKRELGKKRRGGSFFSFIGGFLFSLLLFFPFLFFSEKMRSLRS